MMDGGVMHGGGQEAERTAGARIEPGRAYGFFTDVTLCIGCKACEVACKEWNALPADGDMRLTGHSFDNTGALGAETWRHVGFVERLEDRPGGMAPFQSQWVMFSDVCKHCDPAPCLEACPTGAIFRTEFDTVVVQQDICNGCTYCVPACPFGVIEVSKADGKAHKCTLCHDRLKGGLEPACSKACPTDSIQFGALEELIPRAYARVEQLHAMGQDRAYLYGAPGTPGATNGLRKLNAFFLLTERPEVHGLPAAPSRPAPRGPVALAAGLAAVAGLAAAALALGLAGGRRR